jgi:hypothetical protein
MHDERVRVLQMEQIGHRYIGILRRGRLRCTKNLTDGYYPVIEPNAQLNVTTAIGAK